MVLQVQVPTSSGKTVEIAVDSTVRNGDEAYEAWKRAHGLDRQMSEQEVLAVAREFSFCGW